MNTTKDNQIEILTGMVQSLINKVEKIEASQLPQHQWLSSREMAIAVGVSERTIQGWRKLGKFPKETYCTRRRGTYNIYKFKKTLAIPVAEKLARGDY